MDDVLARDPRTEDLELIEVGAVTTLRYSNNDPSWDRPPNVTTPSLMRRILAAPRRLKDFRDRRVGECWDYHGQG
jgi:hypothetical protein